MRVRIWSEQSFMIVFIAAAVAIAGQPLIMV